MSDFDKEAEREKLREKYEAEREDREATQHMSELLLKGATMTNAHCGTCGDPIFRYDGQEFCPTCSNQVQNDAEATTDADATQADDATTDRGQAVDAGTGSTDAVPETGASAVDESTTQRTAAGQQRDASTGQHDAAATTEPGAATTGAATVDATGDAVANVEATVERFAAAAADTDDPERAREYLAVVRDATDTLRTLRGDAR
jgi:uncharacterized Zn finger protein (UPF0148 family)